MQITDLPAVNACLNGLAAACLVTGFVLIRQGRREAHRKAMLAAFGCSIAFLVSYLYYHSQVGSVRFQGTGPIRGVYFTILISHTVLAALVPFLASVTLYRAWRGRFEQHRALARWTLPIWLYVSLTGIAVYWMLYHLDARDRPTAEAEVAIVEDRNLAIGDAGVLALQEDLETAAGQR